MPGGDRTGPPGRSGAGRGGGRGGGLGRNQGRGSILGGNRPGAGPSGECVCPNCGVRLSHQIGMPCYNLNCPECGTKMARG